MRTADVFARCAAAREAARELTRLETEIRDAIELRGENGKHKLKSENLLLAKGSGFCVFVFFSSMFLLYVLLLLVPLQRLSNQVIKGWRLL